MIDHLRDKGLGVDPVCRVLDLSPSTYFARKTRPKSARKLRDEELIPLVTAAWEDSSRTYGARRIARALARAGHRVARCTVERLMRELGIEGVIRGQRRRTTIPEPAAPRPPDLVNRRFTAERPNQLWLANLTYITAQQPVVRGGQSLALTSSKSAWTKGKRELSQPYAQADFSISGVANTVDGGAVQATLLNWQTTAY